MTISVLHDLFLLIADKDKNGYWTHENIDNFLHVNQLSYFSMLIGDFRKHQPGRPVPPVSVGQNSRTNEELNPFKTRIDFFTQPYDAINAPYGVTNGVLAMPLDYEHMDSIIVLAVQGTTIRERPAQELDGEEWAERADSDFIVPSKLYPFYRYNGKGGTLNGIDIGQKQKLEFRPKDVSGHLFYYRTPAKSNYAYTLNTTTRVETHDASTSTDLEWGEVATVNILIRALQLAGVPQADQALWAAMNADKISEE